MSVRPSARAEIRRNRYKVAVDPEEGRRRREDSMVEIRKSRREESLKKKRRVGLQSQLFAFQDQSTSSSIKIKATLQNLPEMVAGIWTDDGNSQLKMTHQFRLLLSICYEGVGPPIEEVIQSGVVPRFVEFLMRKDFPQLQFEAAWALTNIASGTTDHTKVVIDHGAVPVFVELLVSSGSGVREQAVWALGNIAGDSAKSRDIVLGHGALAPLLVQLNGHPKLSMLRNATWTLSNLCRGKPQPAFDQMRPALPVLQQLIHSNDQVVLTDACWALSHLSDGTNETIQAVIESGVFPRLVDILHHPFLSVIIPALRTVGNIVTGDDIQTQHVIDNRVLPCFLNFLANNCKSTVKREACWALSNITAGTDMQIQAVIDSGIIGPLVDVLQNAEFGVKKEAAWAISNATSGSSHEQIKFLVSQGCIMPLCSLLLCPDPQTVTVCLEGLENILRVGEAERNLGQAGDINVYAQIIDDAGGLEKLETLQCHDNNEIYVRAVRLLETYWLEEDDDTRHPSFCQFEIERDDLPFPSGGFRFI